MKTTIKEICKKLKRSYDTECNCIDYEPFDDHILICVDKNDGYGIIKYITAFLNKEEQSIRVYFKQHWSSQEDDFEDFELDTKQEFDWHLYKEIA